MAKRLKLNLRNWQKEIWTTDARFVSIVASRRAGKSEFFKRRILHQCLTHKARPSVTSKLTIMIVFPTLKQAKAQYWAGLKGILCDQLGEYTYNTTEATLTPKDPWRPHVRFAGEENLDKGERGFKLLSAYLDELQSFKSIDTWERVIAPSLIDTPGTSAYLSGTAKGRFNPLYAAFSGFIEKGSRFTSFLYPFNEIENDINSQFPEDHQDRITQQGLIELLGLPAFRQECLCDFDIFSSQLLHAFDPLSHLTPVAPYQRAGFSLVIIGIDHGSSNPAYTVSALRFVDNQPQWEVLETYTPSTRKLATLDDFLDKLQAAAIRFQADTVYSPDDVLTTLNAIKQRGAKLGIRAFIRAESVSRSKLGVAESYRTLNNLFRTFSLFVRADLKELQQALTSVEDDGMGKPANGVQVPLHLIDCLRYSIGEYERRQVRGPRRWVV
jgi:hypothetical protein